ncbi:MAG: GIY-YIG nuclease family protein [Bacteroidales bacterium]
MLYKVYVLYSPSFNKLFIGLTTGLGDSMVSHNGAGDDDWTNAFKPWTLIHMELFNDETEALLRKTYLESQDGLAYVRSDILPLFDF